MTPPRTGWPLVAVTLGALALAVALPASAHGQSGSDLFAGYSFARIADVDRHGADVALGFRLAGPVSAFVDTSAHWGGSAGLDRDDLTLMAGPDFRLRRGGSVFFVRALLGLVRDTAAVDVLDVRISESGTRFGVMGGGGVDLHLTGRWAVRLQGDYLWHDAVEGTRSGFRLSAGAVWRFGTPP